MQRKPGPARAIQPHMVEGVIELLASWLSSYQNKVAHFLFNEYNIKVTQPTISKLLKELQITRKKIKVVVAQQNDELQEA